MFACKEDISQERLLIRYFSTKKKIDVTDVAWSPDNTYLASAGLDSKIIIWDGRTFGMHDLKSSTLDILLYVCIPH